MAGKEALEELTGGVRIFYPIGQDSDYQSESDQSLANLLKEIGLVTKPLSLGLITRVVRTAGRPSWLESSFLGQSIGWQVATPETICTLSLRYRRRQRKPGGEVVEPVSFYQTIGDLRTGQFFAETAFNFQGTSLRNVRIRWKRGFYQDYRYQNFVETSGQPGQLIDEILRAVPLNRRELGYNVLQERDTQLILAQQPWIIFSRHKAVKNQYGNTYWSDDQVSYSYRSGSDTFMSTTPVRDFAKESFLNFLRAVIDLVPRQEITL